jgi:hypothetical protein
MFLLAPRPIAITLFLSKYTGIGGNYAEDPACSKSNRRYSIFSCF